MSYLKSPFLILCFLCLCSIRLSAQEKQQRIEYFKRQIDKANPDSIKVPLILKYSDTIGLFDIDAAREIVLEAKDIIDRNGYASRYFQKLKVETLQSLTNCALIQGDLSEALKYQQQTLDLSLKIKDTIGLGKAYVGRGIIFQKKNDTLNAEKYYRLALEVQKGKSDPYDYAYTHMKLGHIYNKYRKLDSARYFFRRAKAINPTERGIVSANANIGTSYIYEEKYEEAIQVLEESLEIINPTNYLYFSSVYNNLASCYSSLEEHDQALTAIDSAISYTHKIGDKTRLRDQYDMKFRLSEKVGRYKDAFKAHKTYKVYADSLNNIDEIKRFTELELNYEFEKEKEIADVKLKSETSKKRLYTILFFTVLFLSVIAIYVILKNKKQKIALANNEVQLKQNVIELQQLEKLKAELALANKESELKKILIESSITEEVLNKTLDDIKDIITSENEPERKLRLRSLSASLLSEKAAQKTTTTLHEYLDQVALDFKIHLDSNFPELRSNEKELLYLMKVGLNATEISKLQSVSISSVKSLRHRIRKKLNLDSQSDIVAYLEGEQ